MTGPDLRSAAAESSVEVSVDDLGKTFRVAAGAAQRTFSESGRDCDKRASAAAVFISVALQQSQPTSPSTTMASSNAPQPMLLAASPPVVDRRRLHVDGEIGGQIAGAGGHGGATGGGSVRLSGIYRHGAVVAGLALGADALSPLRLQFDHGAAFVQRVPLTFDGRVGLRRGPFEAQAGVGLAITVLRVQGADLPVTQTTVRAEPGLHIAALARWWLVQRVAPQVDVDAVVVPAPYAVAVAPSGNVVGHLPAAWLSASIGLAVRIR
jgi:hypothetical protein